MASQQQAQVLQNLGGGWLQCQDAQGVFYHNSVTQEWSETPPVQGAAAKPIQAAPMQAMPVQAMPGMPVQAMPPAQHVQQAAQAMPPAQHVQQAAQVQQAARMQQAAQAQQGQVQPRVKMTLGDWRICEDAQGEYYVHTPSNQTFDQPPQQLVQLYQASQGQQVAQPMAQPVPQPVAQPMPVQAAPPLPAHVQAQAQPQAQQAPRVKKTLGEWQICEDAQGEYYVHAPTGQAYDQPPPQLAQLAQAPQPVQQPVPQPVQQQAYAQAAYAAPPAAKMAYAAPPAAYAAHPPAQQYYAQPQQQQYR